MARGRTIESERVDANLPVTASGEAAPDGFGAEFRELARQRRFVRGTDAPSVAATQALPAPHAAAAASTPAPAPRPQAATPAPVPAPAPASRRPATRITDDQRAMLAELARMSDRLVESRELLAATTARAERAESDLAAANDRLMAARALVHDAQQATHASAERCAWLEGRCEALQEALEVAVHASLVQRWKWRRQSRATR